EEWQRRLHAGDARADLTEVHRAPALVERVAAVVAAHGLDLAPGDPRPDAGLHLLIPDRWRHQVADGVPASVDAVVQAQEMRAGLGHRRQPPRSGLADQVDGEG